MSGPGEGLGTARWNPPSPKMLPEWRARLIEYTGSNDGRITLRTSLSAGKAALIPTFPGARSSPESMAALTLSAGECSRLAKARLYYASDDMTSLALAAGSKPPQAPMSLSRLPSPYGFMVFAEPIGGYEQHLHEALEGTGFTPGGQWTLTTPIVAVSWGPFHADQAEGIDLDGTAVQWVRQGPQGLQNIPRDYPEGVWLTFYAGYNPLDSLSPSTVVAYAPDGSPLRVLDMIEHREGNSSPVLNWDNEMLLLDGATWPDPAEPDTTQQWSQVIYTAWQCMTQTGKRQIVEVEEVPLSRTAAKRAARRGAGPHPGSDDTVRIVRVHSSHRPSRSQADQDAEASTGRRAPNWSCRWPVDPHRRNQCLNPRGHASGDCQHDEVIIPWHVKGPPDKPLRVRDTVHLWDQMPADPEASG